MRVLPQKNLFICRVLLFSDRFLNIPYFVTNILFHDPCTYSGSPEILTWTFFRDIRYNITLCWPTHCLSAQKRYFPLNLSFMYLLLVWNNNKIINVSKHLICLLQTLFLFILWCYPVKYSKIFSSVSSIFYCNRPVPIQVHLQDFRDQFGRVYKGIYFTLLVYTLFFHTKSFLSSNMIFVFWLLV